MAESSVEAKTCATLDLWRERVAEHSRSGLSVKQFCKERGISAWSFYSWRKRLREVGPVRFALIERGPVREESAVDAQLEVVLVSGERVRIGSGVEATTLRLVMGVLRA
jgi:transposase-like protein